MSNSLCSQLRYFGLISLLTLQGIFVASSARATCYSTPRTAIDAVITGSLSDPDLKSGDYQVVRIQPDSVLGQRWAMIANCDHPEWPAFALPVNRASSPKAPQGEKRSLTESVRTAPVVRAGETVRLWRQESLLRIEVAGVSEESGDLGKTIRVRLLRRNTDDQSIPEQFSGVVRGPSNVEILP
jgi:hypothetical protein